MTKQWSSKCAILPTCLPSLNFSRRAYLFFRVENATTLVICKYTGFSFQAFLRTCSHCFQSRRLHTIARGSFALVLPLFFRRSTHWALSVSISSISKSSLALLASLTFDSTSSQLSFSTSAMPLIRNIISPRLVF